MSITQPQITAYHLTILKKACWRVAFLEITKDFTEIAAVTVLSHAPQTIAFQNAKQAFPMKLSLRPVITCRTMGTIGTIGNRVAAHQYSILHIRGQLNTHQAAIISRRKMNQPHIFHPGLQSYQIKYTNQTQAQKWDVKTSQNQTL